MTSEYDNFLDTKIKPPLKEWIHKFSYKENHEQMFTLASGKKSPYYFDLKQTLLDPHNLQLAGEGLYYLMLKDLASLPAAAGGLTMGADPLIYALSLLAAQKDQNILPFIVRKKTKDHGSKNRVEGRLADISDKNNLVLIDDVITTGGSTIQALDSFEDIGFTIKHAFCILDRKEGGSEALQERGVLLHPLFTLADFAS